MAKPRLVSAEKVRHEPHRCPPWCHLCPNIEQAVREHMHGQGEHGPPEPNDCIMPWCMGTSAFDADHCTCETPIMYWRTRARDAERRERSLRRALTDRLGDEDPALALLIGESYPTPSDELEPQVPKQRAR